MRTITKKELKDILVKHKKWLEGKEGGEQANLSNTYLSNMILAFADLRHANLESACMVHTNLSHASLTNANLNWANLSSASLDRANLENASLLHANLCNANLLGANLVGATLLNDTNLEYANLSRTTLDKKERIRRGLLLSEDLIGFKCCAGDRIVELRIPKGSIVFSINNYKCRTNRASVISITDIIDSETNYSMAASIRDENFIYEVGKTLEIDDFDLQYNIECSTGIHFFRTREEAVNYY